MLFVSCQGKIELGIRLQAHTMQHKNETQLFKNKTFVAGQNKSCLNQNNVNILKITTFTCMNLYSEPKEDTLHRINLMNYLYLIYVMF